MWDVLVTLTIITVAVPTVLIAGALAWIAFWVLVWPAVKGGWNGRDRARSGDDQH